MVALVVMGSVTVVVILIFMELGGVVVAIVMMLPRSGVVARVRIFVMVLLNTFVVVVDEFLTVVAAVVIVVMVDILHLMVIKMLVFAIISLVAATGVTLGVTLVFFAQIEVKAIFQIPLDPLILLVRVLWLHLKDKMTAASVSIVGVKHACV